ncbi:hypothetical protein G6F22_019828 [Rhizopus arrhizus]|nr:hypothetical protein G6F22_019828 [Rhizopus arrhizus]
MNLAAIERQAGEAEMDAENTLQLVLDANTNVLTAIYTPPPRPDAAPADDDDAPAAEASGSAGGDDAPELDADTDVAVDTAPHINLDLPTWDALTAAVVAQGWTADALDNHAWWTARSNWNSTPPAWPRC